MEIKPLVISDLKPALNVTLVKDTNGLKELADFLAVENEYGFDVETNIEKSLFNRYIRTLQLGNRNKQFVIDLLQFAQSTDALMQQGNKTAPKWAKSIVETVSPALESWNTTKLGVNLQFDYEAVRWCLGIRARKFYDCLLAEKVLYAGRVRFDAKGFWSMLDMVERYCRLKIDKELQKSFDLSSDLTQDQINYAALDTRLPFPIRAGQMPQLEKAGLIHTALDIEMPAIMPFGDMKIAGFKIDKERWLEQVDKVKKQQKLNLIEMDYHFVPIVGTKEEPKADLVGLETQWKDCDDREQRKIYRDAFQSERKRINEWKKASIKWEGEAAINYGSHVQLKSALSKVGLDLSSTNDDVLKKHTEDHPAVKSLQKYRTAKKLLDTYGINFIENYIDPKTGRVHSNINQLGADTGRTSASDPNTQNLPQEEAYSNKNSIKYMADPPRYRSCFVAEKGKKIITRDYDGCELRIIAELSGEASWIDAFNTGKDVHSMCAEMVFGDDWKNGAEEGCAYYSKGKKCKCKKHKELRNGVKAVNFGIAYGAEAQNISEQLGITRAAAQELLDRHKATFVKVHAMLKDVGDRSKTNLEMRTIGGRRRLFTKPTWEAAKEIAYKRAIEDGKPTSSVTAKKIQRIYFSMWASIEREGKNTPFQGTNADMAKVAMALCWEDLEPKYGAVFTNMVHDELVIEAPDETVEECDKFVGEMMEKAGELYVKSMRMTSGGNIDECWSKGD